MPDQDTLSPEDSAALVHAQQQLYSAGDPRAAKLYNYIVQAGYATKGDNGELHPQGETKSFYDQNIKGTLSGTAGWQQSIDKASQTEPLDTSSVSGFAKSAANNLGAGATRVFSPLVHPGNAIAGLGKTMSAAMGDTGAQYDIARGLVEPAVRNPSGEAIAAIPQALMATAGAGEAPGAMRGAANVADRVISGAGKVASDEEGAMGAAGMPGGLEEKLKVRLGGPPEQMMTSAIKPGKNNVGWTSDIKTAIPLMKSAEQATGTIGASGSAIDDAIAAAKAAKQGIWQQIKQRMGPAAAQGAAINGDAVADAMMGSIDKRMAQQNPGLTSQIEQAASMYRGKMIPVDDAENFIQSNNKELIGYYAKNKVSQAAAEADPVIASKVAEGNALRDGLYGKLDNISGPGVAQMKKAYGALSNVQKELTGRQIVYARQAPINLPEQLSYLRAAGKIATGNVLGGIKDIAVQRFLSDVNDTNSQIARAFRNAEPAKPFPAPNWKGPQTVRLLPAQSSAKIPLMAPDPGMSGGERIAAAMQEFRRKQQLQLPAQAEPFRLPPPQ